MKLKRAERKKVALKLGLAGPSGSGKTYSGLLLAKGLVGDWEKVAVIDTENGSADLYAHLGAYNTLTLEPPFEPEKFLKALDACIEAGMGAVVIDSISHEWMGEGGVLDYQSNLGGQWKDWAKATPRHRRFIDGILQAPVHVICCSRVKTEWTTDKNEKGKTEPKKVGLKLEQREGIEYEYTVAFRLSQTHMAEADKDRTGLFAGKADFRITEETGKQLLAWANSGVDQPDEPCDLTNTAHKRAMFDLMRKEKLSDDDMKRLAPQCVGVRMSLLPAKIREFADPARGVFSTPAPEATP